MQSGGQVAAKTNPSDEFIVSVAPIKAQIQVVKKKLEQLAAKDSSKQRQVNQELRILKKCWDDLGNLEF
jgi:hypothetical protein